MGIDRNEILLYSCTINRNVHSILGGLISVKFNVRIMDDNDKRKLSLIMINNKKDAGQRPGPHPEQASG